MKTRAIKDLAQLSDNNLFEEIAQGLNLVVENAICIEADSIFLAEQERTRGCKILRSIAQEEASKFLILLDAIRCDRKSNAENFSRQLGYFNDHLPKLIYAQCYSFRPADFREICEWIESAREQYYLDGPNEVDWIFPNQINHNRENLMYVDYIKMDNKHYWIQPDYYNFLDKGRIHYVDKLSTDVLKLVNALHNVGISRPEALEIIASRWKPVKMSDNFYIQELKELNLQTLNELREKDLLHDQPNEVYATIVERWLFPLHSLDLSEKKVKESELRGIQKQRSQDFY